MISVKPMIAIETRTALDVVISRQYGQADIEFRRPSRLRVELSLEDAKQLWSELGNKLREFKKDQP